MEKPLLPAASYNRGGAVAASGLVYSYCNVPYGKCTPVNQIPKSLYPSEKYLEILSSYNM
jgi:hypothetical protein